MRVKLSVLAVKVALKKWANPSMRESFAYSVRYGYNWSSMVDGFTYDMYAADWKKLLA